MKWRLVEDKLHSNMFGIELEMDDRAIIEALVDYIGQLKDRYDPKRDTIKCKLILDTTTLTVSRDKKGR